MGSVVDVVSLKTFATNLEQIHAAPPRVFACRRRVGRERPLPDSKRARIDVVRGSQPSRNAMNHFAVVCLATASTAVIARRSRDRTSADASSSAARNVQASHFTPPRIGVYLCDIRFAADRHGDRAAREDAETVPAACARRTMSRRPGPL
jgi:hypothetical protein